MTTTLHKLNTVDQQISGFMRMILNNFLLILLVIFVAFAACFLVNESGKFLNSLSLNHAYWGYIAAALLEIAALLLIVYLPDSTTLQWVRLLTIMGIFIAITGGSAMHAVNPILTKSRIDDLDQVKIDSLRAEISGLEADASRLSKQPQNLAVVTRKKQAANERLQTALESAESRANSFSNQANRSIRICILVLARILLQAANWMLIGWASRIIQRRRQGSQRPAETVSRPAYEISAPAGKLLQFIQERGSIRRQQLLESKQLGGAQEYDQALGDLISCGLVGKQNGGKISETLYFPLGATA
jgi:hypothetical protein